jgi:hypothetical protein
MARPVFRPFCDDFPTRARNRRDDTSSAARIHGRRDTTKTDNLVALSRFSYKFVRDSGASIAIRGDFP